MFAYLEGRLVTKAPTHIVIDVHGVGYEVHIPLSSYDQLGSVDKAIRIFTYLHVREDTQQLYGFMTEQEKNFFRLLLTVSGIGPKMALAILSGSSLRGITKAIRQGDAHFLKTIPGIGKKLAERLVVELKEKVGVEEEWAGKRGYPKTGEDILWNDAIQALISLGFRQSVAQEAIRKALSLNSRPLTAEELVKESLKHVSQK